MYNILIYTDILELTSFYYLHYVQYIVTISNDIFTYSVCEHICAYIYIQMCINVEQQF